MSGKEITETRQYLTFKLGNEVFGIDVAKVREVLDFTTITEIPRTPDFMSGVINLRGSVVPVVDLRLCFQMSKTVRTRNTCIVVVEVQLEGEATVIGALADSVEEVIDLEPDQIQPAPKIGTQIRTDFIKGMGKREAQFIMILDIDRVFSAEELSAVRDRGRNRDAGGSDRLSAGNASGSPPLFSPVRPMTNSPMNTHADSLSSRDLNRLCRLIYEQSGITLGAEKKIMLEGRLKRRMTSLHLSSYKEYCDYLFEGKGHDVEEMVHLIDAVSHQQDRLLPREDALRFPGIAVCSPTSFWEQRTPGKS